MDDYHDPIGLILECRTMKQAHRWPEATAKAKFSQLLEQAQTHGPQTVTRRGRPPIVVVSAQDWEAKAQRSMSLVEFFMHSPLRASGLKVRRFKTKLRKAGL